MVGITSPPCRPWIAADHARSGPKKGLSRPVDGDSREAESPETLLHLLGFYPAGGGLFS